MSRHHEPATGGAGADEEFIDQAPETPGPGRWRGRAEAGQQGKGLRRKGIGRVAGAGEA